MCTQTNFINTTLHQSEYLTSLREFHKTKNEQSIQIGDIVQIHNESPRVNWKLGIVNELIRGNDGHVRAARIQTSNGETSRPIVKLFPLEVSGTHSDATSDHIDEQHEDTIQRSTRPKRNASIKAREKIRKWITNVDENYEED
ncbi:Hypothetical predicted protein [Mytilus galloprovincialis]|uniref:DUF5641 domain-containing protein n=1 Tax=Mytilus galloprovincialis TaxID=29158 RepID=A0A8B6CUR2_MYTGA|nr:Hypothetical predicted protein [Mytilus galloprovincialis]